MIPLKKLFYRITGGRPMKQIDPNGRIQYMPFCDVVSGKMVWYWLDGLNKIWMAENKWGWFRVRRNMP